MKQLQPMEASVMGYDIEGVGRSVEHLAHKVSSLTDAVTDNVK